MSRSDAATPHEPTSDRDEGARRQA
jgi:hypothetical protein